MDPMAEEQLDYEDEDYGANQKMPFQTGGAISALADEELMGEDDEYDDLYNDVNVGDGFMQSLQHQEPVQYESMGNGVQAPKEEPISTPPVNIPGVGHEEKGEKDAKLSGFSDLDQKKAFQEQASNQLAGASSGLKIRVSEPVSEPQPQASGFRNAPAPPAKGSGFNTAGAMDANKQLAQTSSNAVPRVGPGPGPGIGAGPNANMNRMMGPGPNQAGAVIDTSARFGSENSNRLSHGGGESGNTMLFVGELQWWTTDAELESVLSQYGRVKDLKFFDERASGKSKGYCQVEFYDPAAAAACKESMNGHVFNGRACVVAFASQHTLKQLTTNYLNKTQAQAQAQSQGRRPMNDGGGRAGGPSYQGGDRNYGNKMGWGRGNQGVPNRGQGPAGLRGRPGGLTGKAMVGGPSGANPYGQALSAPPLGGPPGGLLHPQGMMGSGFDPTYGAHLGRGSGYGGFSGPHFPGMLPSFSPMGTVGLPGVAPHVNPAFFGRGVSANGMGMMGSGAMDGHHGGMWGDSSMGGGVGWGNEEHGRRTRESSYGDDGASDYGYGDGGHERGGGRSNPGREKDRGSERDWSSGPERRHRDDRDSDWDRDPRYKDEKDGYSDHRQRERDWDNEDDWDRGRTSSRSRSKSRMMQEEDQRSRSKDVDYGKRRRVPSE
ncbi:hypothetical protein AMTRI_Chr06g177210 [Amborella trichopoda]|uniref:RRM domain-containing protein n=1 Tax=Amborella trichopoda TaxID=13333 RepID=W1PUL2_AMBTC|nr:cleavage and polyadenylation specificity factor subunit 6 [Amborella trichopoda]ERN13697.1 hypothetical protein AMTR_s00049p00146760 [Amborella trichopoda]|eukprot:XP_006852230.1 cleavage and polyadenylation specificity factor subunit 6 [Amborella trichopoda]